MEKWTKNQLEHLAGLQTQQIGELQGEVEKLRDWSNGGSNGVAISNLAKIIGDNTASVRQRVKAAGALLAYKVDDDSIVGFARGFLESVCASADNFDYRIEAGAILRRYEAPLIAPERVRPTYPTDVDPDEPKPIPLRELVRIRRERADRMEREDIESGRRDPLTGRWNDRRVVGNGSDGSDGGDDTASK